MLGLGVSRNTAKGKNRVPHFQAGWFATTYRTATYMAGVCFVMGFAACLLLFTFLHVHVQIAWG